MPRKEVTDETPDTPVRLPAPNISALTFEQAVEGLFKTPATHRPAKKDVMETPGK